MCRGPEYQAPLSIQVQRFSGTFYMFFFGYQNSKFFVKMIFSFSLISTSISKFVWPNYKLFGFKKQCSHDILESTLDISCRALHHPAAVRPVLPLPHPHGHPSSVLCIQPQVDTVWPNIHERDGPIQKSSSF